MYLGCGPWSKVRTISLSLRTSGEGALTGSLGFGLPYMAPLERIDRNNPRQHVLIEVVSAFGIGARAAEQA